MSQKTGGQILASMLALNGVERVSCVAGESYLPVLDALLDHPDIKVITNRQEGGSAFMAESWGKLSGKPGICFVTRGPGVCNASIGVHTAMQDSTPMILFMGQVKRAHKGREAFQEVSVEQVFGSLAKWAIEINKAARIPEIVNRAFTVATSGRPGPVVIGLPEDILSEMTETPDIAPAPILESLFRQDDLDQLINILSTAQRPVALVGGSGWTDQACQDFASFASRCHLPVAAAFRRQDLFDHNNRCYVGELGTGPNPKLVEKIKEADLLLVVGSRLNDITMQGYTLIDDPHPQQKIIHIHASAHEIGKVYEADIGIVSDIKAVCATLAGSAVRKIDGRRWAAWRDELRGAYEEWTTIDFKNQPEWKGANVSVIFDYLRSALPNDAIITTDAGNFSGWAQRYLRYGRPGRLLAPLSGAMGYAVPSAIGASITAPEKTVLGLCGDGGFMMTGQELATAMHHGAHPVIMVFNNGMYGTIRMHQQRDFPGRVSATALTNPDFAALAKSYGAFSAVVENASDFPAIWEEALTSGKAALIEVRMDPRQITTNARP